MTLRQPLNISDHSQFKKNTCKLQTVSIQPIINTMKMAFFLTKVRLGVPEEIVDCLFCYLFPSLPLDAIFTFLGKAGGGNSSKCSRKFFIECYFLIPFVIPVADQNLNPYSPTGHLLLWSSEKPAVLLIFYYYSLKQSGCGFLMFTCLRLPLGIR